MARSVAWRRTCSDAVSWHQDQASNTTIFILREIGPTGFLLKEEEEDKKFKVFLGDPHSCTCPAFRKEKELCKHISWVLLKKFRVPRQNPVTWQLGLVEREINEILRGLLIRQDPKKRGATVQESAEASAPDGRPQLVQRDISEDDVCPICQEELLAKHEPVTYCKYACGNSIHIKCMKVWAEHQKSTGETNIKCPLCREDFGPFEVLNQEYRNSSSRTTKAERLDRHLGITCKSCHICPIQGKCYKCSVCAEYHLCQECFSGTSIHTEHGFQFRQKCTQRWRPAQRGSGAALPEAIVNNLLNREITDNDYDVLLQLDNRGPGSDTLTEEILGRLTLKKVRPGSKLLAPGEQCRACLRGYHLSQYVRVLPCKHEFHKDCIDQWLLHQRGTCPVDGQRAYVPTQARENSRPRRQESCTEENQRPTELVLEIPGIGFRGAHAEGSAGATGQGSPGGVSGMGFRGGRIEGSTGNSIQDSTAGVSGIGFRGSHVEGSGRGTEQGSPGGVSGLGFRGGRIEGSTGSSIQNSPGSERRRRTSINRGRQAQQRLRQISHTNSDHSGLELSGARITEDAQRPSRRLPRGSSPPLEFEIIQLDNPFPLGRPESLPRSTNSFQSPAMAADGSSVPSSAGSSVGSRVGSMGSSRIGSSVSSSKPPTGLFVGQHQSQPDSDPETVRRRGRAIQKTEHPRRVRSFSRDRSNSQERRSSSGHRVQSNDLFVGLSPAPHTSPMANLVMPASRTLHRNKRHSQHSRGNGQPTLHRPERDIELIGNALSALSTEEQER